MTKKRTHDEYVALLKDIRPGMQVLEEYKDNLTNILHRCECGELWFTRPATVLNSKRPKVFCKACSRPRITQKRKGDKQYDEWIRQNRPGIKRIEEYKNTNIPILHICECGTEWIASPCAVKSMQHCPRCNRERLDSWKNDYAKWLKIHRPHVQVIGEYTSNSSYTDHICECGTIFSASPIDVKKGKKCNECVRKKREEKYIEWLSKNNKTIDLASSVTILEEDALHRCKKCGYEWNVSPLKMKQSKSLCPACRLNKTARDFHIWLNYAYKGRKILNDRKMINPFEIDFWLPDENIGIEFNDIATHFCPFTGQPLKDDWNTGKPESYHFDKYKLAKEKGIRLIQIWDVEWQDDRMRPILQSVIRHALGFSRDKIGARQCDLVRIPSYAANEFFKENHLQGAAKGSGYFGLYYNTRLVGAICYAKSEMSVRKTAPLAPYTISRMAFAKDMSVAGGASKLLKAVRDETGNEKIVYRVLNDYFSGASFEKTGWKKVRERDMARYYDIEERKVLQRYGKEYQIRKQKCFEGKMLRYFTSGTTTYIL